MIQQTLKMYFDMNKILSLQSYFNRHPKKCYAKQCQTKLTYWQNYGNVFCWNCIIGICRNKGHHDIALEIAEAHL